LGKRQPAAIAAPEKDPASSRVPGYRMPRITAELNAARPIHLSIIDGIETMAGGEGPWVRGNLRHIKPGVMIVGTNALTTDTVATAVMGYNPRDEGKGPFAKCDNTLLLAEKLGIGTADLNQIEVRGEKIADVMFPFAPPAA
jgi:uncharacterized protein (DUF362 family)